MSEQTPTHSNDHATRRDFLIPATASVGIVVVSAAVWGLGRSFAPTSPKADVAIDLSDIAEGTAITVRFEGKPYVIRHRTAQEIGSAEAVNMSELVDTLAQNLNLAADTPATDENRRATVDGRFIVMSMVCTYLGCVVLDDTGDYNGYFCPCCSSHFDTAGRVRKGSAPRNLPIPNYWVEDEHILVLLQTGTISPGRLDSLVYG